MATYFVADSTLDYIRNNDAEVYEICPDHAPSIPFSEILHLPLCSDTKEIAYEIRLRGVNKIALPFLKRLQPSSRQHREKNEGTINKSNSHHTEQLLKGKWSMPVISKYKCFDNVQGILLLH